MKIGDIGGEFALIKRETRDAPQKDLIVGIGDDCAVFNANGKLCVTTDSLVEGVHFSLKYFSPRQIGMKAIESNVSDIAAMGGIPKYAFVSLVVRKDIGVGFIDSLYKGIKQTCKKYSITLAGGDMSHGKNICITITLIGEVRKICRRSDAKPGDFIMVSGTLGKSESGLRLLKGKLRGESIKYHLEPKARLDFSKKYSKYINAMEDISDGLASEIRNMCEMSKVGAVIFKDNLPLAETTVKDTAKINADPYDLALYGGEEYELVFTVAEKNLGNVPGFLVGEITKKKEIKIYSNGKERPLKRYGYDHFL